MNHNESNYPRDLICIADSYDVPERINKLISNLQKEVGTTDSKRICVTIDSMSCLEK